MKPPILCWVTLLVACAAAGCSTGVTPESMPAGSDSFIEARYLCPDGMAVMVRYNRAEDYADVTLDTASTPVRLPLALSGSGARYSDGAYEIWEAKSILRLTTPDGTVRDNCMKL